MDYTTSDIEEIEVTLNKKYSELEDAVNSGFKTAFDTIRDIIDLERILLNQDKLPIESNEFCSYISKKLKDRKIPFDRNGKFYSLFHDDEKEIRFNPNKDKRSTENRPTNSSLDEKTIIEELERFKNRGYDYIENNDYFDFILYLEKLNKNNLSNIESINKKYVKAVYFQDKFNKMLGSLNAAVKQLDSHTRYDKQRLQELIEHYKQCELTQMNIESGLELNKKKDYVELEAKQNTDAVKLDERNKITFIQKWNIIICSAIQRGVSNVAKLVGIDKKHITNNIRPTENPVTHSKNLHHDRISWFKAVRVVSPSGEEFVFNAKDYFDRQIERRKLDLPLEKLVLVNCRVKTE